MIIPWVGIYYENLWGIYSHSCRNPYSLGWMVSKAVHFGMMISLFHHVFPCLNPFNPWFERCSGLCPPLCRSPVSPAPPAGPMPRRRPRFDKLQNHGNTAWIFRIKEVSWNRGTRKSSNFMGISIINHPCGGAPIYGNPHIYSFNFAPPWPL